MYSTLVIILIYIGGYATLYQFSEPSSLLKQSNQLLITTGRKIDFDANIDRRLFPRPTITLHNVKLTEPNGNTPTFQAKKLQIGIAWSSLLGKQEIEKLVIEELSGSIQQNESENWNIQDLWQLSANQTSSIKLNRLLINRSNLTLSNTTQNLALNNLSLTLERNKNTYQYQTHFQIKHQDIEYLDIQSQGTAEYQNQLLTLPSTNLQFNGKENHYTFSGSLKADINIGNNQLTATNLRLVLNSNRFNTQLNSTIAKIDYHNNHAHIYQLNTLLTTEHEQQTYHSMLASPYFSWQQDKLHSDDISFSLNTQQDEDHQFSLTFNGAGTWQPQDGLRLPNAKIASLQTTHHNQSRFVSEWEGAIHIAKTNHWNIEAKGLFDRQPANLTLNRTKQNIQGNITLSKLDLSNYLTDNTTSYPKWSDKDLQINLAINLGTLKLPTLEINNIQTHLQANAEQTQLYPFTANLYDGTTTGRLTIHNTLPLSWQLQQTSENIQIQPLMQDLFGINHFAGQGHLELNLNSQGQAQQQWLKHLSGSLKIHVNKGQWLGINIAQLIKSIFNTNHEYTPALPNTTFNHFTLEGKIKNGISYHQLTAQMDKPIATLTSQGETNLVTGELKNDLMVQSQDNATPLPIRISGTINNPSISLNYQKITHGSKTPEDKQKAITDTLKQQWQWLNQSSNQDNTP